MIGMRIARAKTGRRKIVMFNGAYHGVFDGVLGVSNGEQIEPLSPGTPAGMVEDIVLLDYDSPTALEIIENMANELAAVLVEPVQSRRPDLQPQTFLRRLRSITRANGTALIFDEMVNGFRAAPGGAQQHFGIKADIALYGKAIGGGLPVGVIAGKAAFLDYIDGGNWQFGDDSHPSGDVVVFGGTFCRHPFAMETVAAVAQYMLNEGPALQSRVNALAAQLADELNLWFQDEEVPLRIARFGSQFKFDSFGPWSALANSIELDLFFMLLVDAGIYVWERRTCCLSVAHTAEDIYAVIRAVKEAVNTLRAGGFPFRLKHGAPVIFREVTSVQKRIFAAMQHSDGQAPYHMPAAWLISGELDLEKLEICLGEIIKRHECLRSGFHLAGGRLLRKITDEPLFFIEEITPSGRNAQQIAADFIRPFNLEQPPLLRLGAAKMADGKHLLVFDSLHIVVDGIALAVVTQELNALYNGSELPPSGAPYSLYEDSMREFEAGPDCAEQLACWRETLAEPPPPVAFPRRGAAVEKAANTAHVREIIPPETMAQIRKTAAVCGATPYMLLLAVYAVLLRSLSGLTETVIGVATAGRTDERFESTVGMFVNTLPLRLNPAMEQPFKEFVAAVRNVCANAFKNQDVPYEVIARATGDTVGTMFTYETADDRSLALAGLAIEELTVPIPGSMFDFSLDAIERIGALHLDFEFDTSAVPEACAHIWARCFTSLIAQICADPQTPAGKLCFLPSATNVEPFITQGLKKDYGNMQSVLEMLDRATAGNPSAIAVIDEKSSITYAELDAQSRRIAKLLIDKYAIGPDTLVAIHSPVSGAVVAVILGILRAGGAFLPLEHDAPPARTTAILEEAGCVLLVTGDSLSADNGCSVSLSIATLLHESTKTASGGITPDKASLAYVIYTSGSTGTPKGCEITHAALLNYIAWTNDNYFSGNECGNFCLTSPLAFDMSLMTLFVPLSRGKTLRIPPAAANPAEALALALNPATETDTLNLTPSHVRIIAELGIRQTNCRIAVVGGEPLSEVDVTTLQKINPDIQVFNEYGPTETTVGCTSTQVTIGSVLSIGTPIYNTAARIVDRELRTLPPGAWGELCISGQGLARGYRNRRELSRKCFVKADDGATLIYRTGDLARILPNGEIELGGRIDEQIKIGGHRIEPGEIESVIKTCPDVENAAVVFDGILSAFFSGGGKGESIRKQLAGLLPAYMLPHNIMHIDKIPVLSSGKTDRKTLLAMAHKAHNDEPAAGDQEPVSPALALLREITGNPRMQPNDNFFAAGGSSLDAVSVVARCREELEINVELRDFFTKPTAETINRSATTRRARNGLVHCASSTTIEQTAGQQQIWLASQKSASAYNMTETFILEGRLDPEKLENAFRKLVQRHEILRTTFREDFCKIADSPGSEARPTEEDNGSCRPPLCGRRASQKPGNSEPLGRLLQEVQPYSPDSLHFTRIELPGSSAENEQAVKTRADEEARFEFDLSRGPLMRITLFSCGNHRSYCLLNIHHIITDGWSAALMLDEVSRLYRNDRKLTASPPWQYRDFSAWHADYLNGPHAAADLDYWKNVLSAPSPRILLPGAKAVEQTSHKPHARPAASVALELNAGLTAQLDTFARQNGATLFMALSAGLAALLHQRTSLRDITLGTPTAGRVLPELELMPGYFLNTLPLRITFNGAENFKDLLHCSAKTAAEAFARQLYPFDRLAEQFDHSRNGGKNPLFDIMLILQNTTAYGFDLPEIQSRRFYTPRSNEAKFDIMIELEHTAGCLTGLIEYDASLYDTETIETFAADYSKTLQTAAAEPATPLNELFPLLADEDENTRSSFLQSLNDVSEDF